MRRRSDAIVEGPDDSVMLVMDFVDGSSLADLTDDELTDELLAAALARGRPSSSCRHRPPLVANGQRHDRRTTPDRGSSTSASPRLPPAGAPSSSTSPSCSPHWRPESAPTSRRQRCSPGSARRQSHRRFRCCSRWHCLQPRSGHRRGRRVSQRRQVAGAAPRRSRIRGRDVARRTGADPSGTGRTFIMIALAAGAFYFILPQLAQVGDSFKAFQSAHWGWVPVIIFMSFLTYVASAFGMIGTVPEHIPFGPIFRCSSLRRSSTGCHPPTSAAWPPTFASCRRTASSRPRQSQLSG